MILSGKIFSGFLIGLLVLANSSSIQNVCAQGTSGVLERIGEIMLTENASALTEWASNPVEIAVFGASRTYSLAQGRYVLEEFFDSVDVLSFSIEEYTESGKGLFVEGTIIVSESRYPLRVYLRLKLSVDGWILREVIFEKKSNQIRD